MCAFHVIATQKLGGFQLSKEAELAHSVYCNSKPRVLGHTIEARAEKALLDRRHVPPKDLMKEIQRETGSDLPYHTTYKAVERVRARLFEEGPARYRNLRAIYEFAPRGAGRPGSRPGTVFFHSFFDRGAGRPGRDPASNFFT